MAQWIKNTQSMGPISNNVFEVVQIGSADGLVSSNSNPLPITGTTINPWGKQVLLVDDDTVQHTSKNRRKVSTNEVTDFATYTNSKDGDIWDELFTGTANSIHDVYQSMVRMEVGSAAGDSAIRQTKRVQRYLPGRQSEVSIVFRWFPVAIGVRRRIGLFDDLDGMFFEDGGDGDFYVVIRRNTAEGIIENRVARADWNIDKLDGTGPSGITAIPEAIQNMSIEYEWYGAGQVEFNFIINNNKYPIHQFNHANVIDHTWAASASLPVRCELTNISGTTGPHYFWQGSHSFSTEGTTTLLGRQKAISSPLTGYTLSSANQFYPVVAIRLKQSALRSVVIPDFYAGATLDNTNVFVRVIEGANVTGGTWVSYNSESAVEYNTTGTSYTNGTTLDTVFVNGTNQGTVFKLPERAITQLVRNTTTTLGDTPSTFLIAIATTNANKDAWASLGWIEVR